MSQPALSYKLILGAIGTLCLVPELVLPLNAAVSSRDRTNWQTPTEIPNHYLALSWQEIWEKIKRKKVAGGTRSNICLISPAQLIDVSQEETNSANINNSSNALLIAENQLPNTNKAHQSWNRKPLFIWQPGKLYKIALKSKDGFYWEKKVATYQNHLFYDGKPLQEGQTYQVVVFEDEYQDTEIYNIQIIDSDRRRQIEADLKQKQIEAKTVDREEIASLKTEYFIEREMWSDALWELYSISHPTNRIKTTLELIKNRDFCRN